MRFLRRYSSTIYGEYRRFGSRWGAVVGVMMAAALLLSRLAGGQASPSTPESLLTDGVLLVGMLYVAKRYRGTLPEGRVTLKELLLLGVWVGGVAAVVYGLLLWVYGMLDVTLVERFADARVSLMRMGEESAEVERAVELVRGYTAGDWGFIGGFRSAVMSVLMSLVAALVFRTEKAEVRSKTKN